MSNKTTTRRQFMKTTAAATGAALASGIASRAYAAEDNTIRLALIGCGGRGSGAAVNGLSTGNGPVKLYAMADVFKDRLDRSHRNLSKRFKDRIDVTEDRKFIGFDAYQKAIDVLRPGDVAILGAYSYCRPTHFDYAVFKGVNVFMEKSFAPDPAGSKRMLKTGEEAEKKGLKVAAGLMCRHSTERQALIRKIRDGAMGSIPYIRAVRANAALRLASPCPADQNELLWQIRNKWHFFWTASGQMIEWAIHQIDEICWIKDAWPVSAKGLCGRFPGVTDYGQDLHTYAIDYTFADGTHASLHSSFGDRMNREFQTQIFGGKCAGHFSGPGHAANSCLYKDHRIHHQNIAWKPEREKRNPWQAEWDVLIAKIRKNENHNETKRALYSNLAGILGRTACHTGQLVTWDQLMGSDFAFCDSVDTMDESTPAPVMADANGQYPVPVPGQWKEL